MEPKIFQRPIQTQRYINEEEARPFAEYPEGCGMPCPYYLISHSLSIFGKIRGGERKWERFSIYPIANASRKSPLEEKKL
jgi:hypothetical protein